MSTVALHKLPNRQAGIAAGTGGDVSRTIRVRCAQDGARVR
jgi:hypothetical protein